MLIHVWIVTEIQYIAHTLDKSVALGENVFLELMNDSVVIENLWTGKNQILVNKQKLIKTTSTVMKRTNIYLTCNFFFGESMPVSVTQIFGSLNILPVKVRSGVRSRKGSLLIPDSIFLYRILLLPEGLLTLSCMKIK